MADQLIDNVIATALNRLAKAEMGWGKVHPKVIKELLNLSDLYLEYGSELALAEQFYVAALWILDQQEDRYQSDTMGRLFLKLYGVYKLTGNQEKISEIETRLYAYLKRGYNARPSRPINTVAAVA